LSAGVQKIGWAPSKIWAGLHKKWPSEHLFETDTTRIAVRRGFACRFIQLCVPSIEERKSGRPSALTPGSVCPKLFRSISTAVT